MSTSVQQTTEDVTTLLPLVQTTTAVSPVAVTQVTQEMESPAQVCKTDSYTSIGCVCGVSQMHGYESLIGLFSDRLRPSG